MKTVKESLKSAGFHNMDNVLLNEFQNACKDPYFKKLVTALKMDPHVLMKYTSSLEDSARECRNCDGCKGLIECKNPVEGYRYLPKGKGEMLEFDYRACPFQEKRRKEDLCLKNIETFGISSDIRAAKMKDIYGDDKNRLPIMKWMNHFIKNYKKDPHQKGLYLHGSFGSGKSYLIAAMFHELAKQNVKSAIVFWPGFLRELKSSFGADFKDKFHTVQTAPLLLIDDIGAESTTVWGRDEILCTILQYRMQEKLPTFFTSNLDLSLLEAHLSVSKEKIDEVKARRIMKRIEQLTDTLELVSVNLRK